MSAGKLTLLGGPRHFRPEASAVAPTHEAPNQLIDVDNLDVIRRYAIELNTRYNTGYHVSVPSILVDAIDLFVSDVEKLLPLEYGMRVVGQREQHLSDVEKLLPLEYGMRVVGQREQHLSVAEQARKDAEARDQEQNETLSALCAKATQSLGRTIECLEKLLGPKPEPQESTSTPRPADTLPTRRRTASRPAKGLKTADAERTVARGKAVAP